MVIPRSFSSFALSIWSNGVKGFTSGNLSWSTLVIAAVRVVFPWSMCPMVPMLTCGLVRWNLAFATGVSYGFLYYCVLRGTGYSPRALAMISLAMLGGTSAYELNCML